MQPESCAAGTSAAGPVGCGFWEELFDVAVGQKYRGPKNPVVKGKINQNMWSRLGFSF